MTSPPSQDPISERTLSEYLPPRANNFRQTTYDRHGLYVLIYRRKNISNLCVPLYYLLRAAKAESISQNESY